MSWSAIAPSNIALIKYMGKADSLSAAPAPLPVWAKRLSEKDKEILLYKNQSLNPSLSYTLNGFVTKAEIKEGGREDRWSPFPKSPFKNQRLCKASKKISFETKISPAGQKKFLDFFKFLKRVFFIPGHYKVLSENNFPLSSGAASSASSFCALTLAVYELAKERSPFKKELAGLNREDLARLSRAGSGSSCRSFFSPWCLWENQRARPFKAPWRRLSHQLILIDPRPKKISSSKAHELAQTSPLFKGRAKRAKQRAQALFAAFEQKSWRLCCKIAYEEFLDMLSLFKTARPPFAYEAPGTKKALDLINSFWEKHKSGPLATMDASANIHLLYRPDQEGEKEEMENLLKDFAVLSSL